MRSLIHGHLIFEKQTHSLVEYLKISHDIAERIDIHDKLSRTDTQEHTHSQNK